VYRLSFSAPQFVRIAFTPNGTPFTVGLFDSSDPANIQALGLCGEPGPQPRECAGDLSGTVDIVLFPCLLDAQGNLLQCTPGAYTLDMTPGAPAQATTARDTPSDTYDLSGVGSWP